MPSLLKKTTLFLSCIAFAISAGAAHFSFGRTIIELPDSAAAAAVSGRSDAYSRVLTPFDLRARTGLASPQEKDYLALAARETRAWPAADANRLQQSFGEIAAWLQQNGIQLRLPDTIRVIRSGCREEFGAEGYTRERNIILNATATELSTHLIAHELFHVYSRFNEAKRDSIYRHFGFRKCNPIAYAAALDGKVITNPDCPEVAHYLTAQTPDGPRDLAIILYSKVTSPEGKGLHELINIGLLALEGTTTQKKPALKDGRPVIYSFKDVPDFFRQIGTNTQYILHPEEISAEHFAMLVTGASAPQPEYLDRIKSVLAGK